MNDTQRKARAQRVNKRFARHVYDSLHTLQTAFPQAIDDVVNIVVAAFSSTKTASGKKWEHLIVCCVKLGHFAAINGNITFPLTLPDSIDRRWKVIAFK